MSAQQNPYSATPKSLNPKPSGSRVWSGAQWGVFAALCVQTILFRVSDLPMANFGTMAALALICGTAIRHPLGFVAPLGIRVVTDGVIHLQTGYGFFSSWPFDYSAYVLIYFMGILASRKRPKSVSRYLTFLVLGGTGSVATYYLLSNFGVWLTWTDTYARTLAGLAECYTLALPFVKGTIIGNLIAIPIYYECWYRATAAISAADAKADVPATVVAK